MKRPCLFIAASMAFVAIGGLAQAGPCTTEIDQLHKMLSKTDAGMGPTGNPDPSPSASGQDTGNGSGTPITTGTSKALEGKAASPSDVQQQNQGQQTAAEAATSGQVPANTENAQASLSRARELDKAGKEADCQNEINKAKAAFGAQ